MSVIENWVLRVADSDLTWFGLNWIRPAKDAVIRFSYVVILSFVLGLPGLAVGVSLIYVLLGRVEQGVWLSMLGLVMLVELPLNMVFAYYWNRRARKLAAFSVG